MVDQAVKIGRLETIGSIRLYFIRRGLPNIVRFHVIPLPGDKKNGKSGALKN